jgi:hypothetical protein
MYTTTRISIKSKSRNNGAAYCMMEEALACARFITAGMLTEKVYSIKHMVVFDFISILTL